jgi:DNA-binding YbaB/EbfC family protein
MNIQHMMKQAQQMQAKLATLQNELATREIDVSVGGGALKVRINGKQEILSLTISPDAVDPTDVATLEELMMTGLNQAIKESQDMVSSAMSKITGGMNLPGMF